VKGVIVDLVHVIYKPEKCNPETLMKTIRKHNFTAKIVKK
jgi:hypothetical protein